MSHFSRKQIIRKRLYSKFVLIILLVVLMFLIHGTWKVWQRSKQSKEVLEISKSEFSSLVERENSIKEKIDRLGTQTGIEEEIRSKFDVAKEGEKMILLVEEEKEILVEDKEKNAVEKFFNIFTSWFQD